MHEICAHGLPMTPGTLHGDHCTPLSVYNAEMGW